eukprot:Skav211455  [mRNA]  locus=scaffold379:130542:131870:- [translate_table: standard]
MADVQYLAVANYLGSDGASSNIASKTYHWNAASSSFEVQQSIPTSGAFHWVAFTMADVQYLAVANYLDSDTDGASRHNIDSKIYKWNAASSSFEVQQNIPTSGAHGLAAFIIADVQYLAVANYYDSDVASHNIASKIYQWNASSGSFEVLQNIQTSGAHGWADFTMADVQYLAVANYFDGTSYSIDSKVYKWNAQNSSFELLQRIGTSGARSWTAFSMADVHYLAVANHFDGVSIDIDSRVYKWHAPTSSFEVLLSIQTKGAVNWASFTIGDAHYLAVANYAGESKVYQFVTTTTTTTLTRTQTSTSTTRTEAPSALHATQFDFVDVGVWSLTALGGYLLAVAVPMMLARLFWKAGAAGQSNDNDAQNAQDAQTLGKLQSDPCDPLAEIEPQVKAVDPEPQNMSIARKMKRSPYILAINMLLESTNLISTPLGSEDEQSMFH